MKIHLTLALMLLALKLTTATETSNPNDISLAKFLNEVNQKLSELYNKEILANWQNEISGPNDLIALTQSEIANQEILKYIQRIWPKVLKFKRLNVTDMDLKRQLAKIPGIGYDVLSPTDLATLYRVMSNMSEIYRDVRLCAFEARNQCNLTIVPDVQKRLHNTTNLDEMEYYWLEWRRKTGQEAKQDFIKFIELYKKTAKLNGFLKTSDFWFKNFEEHSHEAMKLLDTFVQALRPLFLQFHAHIRQALRKTYGVDKVPLNKPYMQNLAEIFIGNAFQVDNTGLGIQLPYPTVGVPNITKSLIERGLNQAQRVYWNIAEYYRSLGMPALEENFWSENAKPKANAHDQDATCSHKAWKYYGLKQQTFSYCPIINEARFFNMFEAISDLYYSRANAAQPMLYQDEPFPNFNDALGKVFSLAAASPTYLEKLKLIESGVYKTQEARINRLYLQALRNIFLLPVFYVLDRYRVNVMDGTVNITNNCAYWELTERFTGASPPIQRSNEDFDAPVKLLIEVDDQYTSQIMSIVLQFQLYKHFCELSGQYEKGNAALPLDLCDLSNQRAIGPLVFKAMSLGSSKSYKDILKLMTNETELKMDGFLEYFEPLKIWLKAHNLKDGAEIDWKSSGKCKP